jgi:hypothetical protein
MSIDLEYAIKTDVKNNPVVREVDAGQRRRFRRTLGLGGLFVAMLLFAAWQHREVVERGFQLEDLRSRLAQAESALRKQRLEYAVLTRPQELERRAAAELGMRPPTENETLILERVPARRAPGAIVASAR